MIDVHLFITLPVFLIFPDFSILGFCYTCIKSDSEGVEMAVQGSLVLFKIKRDFFPYCVIQTTFTAFLSFFVNTLA